jgi:uncharacterized damage-inducible protein DinB
MVRVEQALDSWKAIRKDTAQAVLDMPAAAFRYQPVPELMPFAEIARHILNASHALVQSLLNGVEDFSAPGFRETLKQYYSSLPEAAGAADLAAELGASLEQDCAGLAMQPVEFYAKIIRRLDGQPVTRLEMLQFTKEHELTHRSQLFLYLRLNGVVPPTTRRRMAAK